MSDLDEMAKEMARRDAVEVCKHLYWVLSHRPWPTTDLHWQLIEHRCKYVLALLNEPLTPGDAAGSGA